MGPSIFACVTYIFFSAMWLISLSLIGWSSCLFLAVWLPFPYLIMSFQAKTESAGDLIRMLQWVCAGFFLIISYVNVLIYLALKINACWSNSMVSVRLKLKWRAYWYFVPGFLMLFLYALLAGGEVGLQAIRDGRSLSCKGAFPLMSVELPHHREPWTVYGTKSPCCVFPAVWNDHTTVLLKRDRQWWQSLQYCYEIASSTPPCHTHTHIHIYLGGSILSGWWTD